MIEGKAVVRFGTGDILITPLVREDLSSGCVSLQNKGTHTIGEYTQDFKPEETDTVLHFDNVESLGVLIERLQHLEKMMKGKLGDCLPPIPYEY